MPYATGRINEAKKILAFEVTKLAHGEEEARKAQETAERLFADGGQGGAAVPVTKLEGAAYPEGISLLDLLVQTGLVSSKKEGRRLIDQEDSSRPKTRYRSGHGDSTPGLPGVGLLLQKGKKVFHKVEFN